MTFRRKLWGLAAASLVALVIPAGASGATTIGSDLGRPAEDGLTSTPRVTVANSALAPSRQAAGGLTAPIDGTVVRWRIKVGSETEVTNFRIIRPLGGGLFTGAGTSAPVTPPINAVTSYNVQLTIRTGDFIGIDCCNPDTLRAFAPAGPDTTRKFWFPALPDGGSGRAPIDFFTDETEILINADIEPYRCGGKNATIAGTAGNDTLVGTPGKDVIVGLAGKDKIKGLGGKDKLCGLKGKDKLRGGGGKDFLKGAKGRDRLNGGGGKDKLKGGKGPDRLVGGAGRDKCAGGKGDDIAKKCEVERSI